MLAFHLTFETIFLLCFVFVLFFSKNFSSHSKRSKILSSPFLRKHSFGWIKSPEYLFYILQDVLVRWYTSHFLTFFSFISLFFTSIKCMNEIKLQKKRRSKLCKFFWAVFHLLPFGSVRNGNKAIRILIKESNFVALPFPCGKNTKSMTKKCSKFNHRPRKNHIARQQLVHVRRRDCHLNFKTFLFLPFKKCFHSTRAQNKGDISFTYSNYKVEFTIL